MNVVNVSDSALLDVALDELEFPKVLAHVSRNCTTEMGAMRTLSLRPATNAGILRTDIQRVQEMVDAIASGETVPYDRLTDIRPLMQRARIEGNFLTAPDLLHVAEAMQTSRNLKRYFGERLDRSPALHEFVETLVDNRVLEKHITDAVDETGAVRDNASRELLSIRREIQELSARLRTRLQKILRKFGEEELLQDEFVTQRDGRFVLPLRVENKRAVPGIIHGVSQTGSTVFLEPAETFEMNNDLSLLHNQELREIARILTTLTAEVGAVAHELDAAADVLTDLDVILARARYALDMGGIRPEIGDDDVIELHQVHHPVLRQQAILSRQPVVPLSVSFDTATRGYLISGPNAGGKTVAMKTIGLSVAMALSGIFPLGMCRTNIRRIFTAIGDHQSIDSNLSTFSSQIIRIRDILSFTGPDALILIDEICAGTDPAEGGALAAGVLDSLVERQACFVVTTHQSSLKQYALTRPAIRNASLAFDEKQLQPTFHFLSNVPGNSYAFVLAQNVGLPDVVLTRARGYLGDRHDELEQSIAAMQRFRAEAEEQRMKAAEEAMKAERLRRDLDERLQQVKKKRSELVDEAREEARDILRKAQSLVENTIREVREQQRSANETKKDFERQREEIVRPREEPADTQARDQGDIKIGSAVMVDGTSSAGTVIKIDARAATALVEVNGIKFRFPLAQLRPTNQKAVVQRDSGVFMKFDSRTSCDMRGMRADEGLKVLEQFISDAIMGNIASATIIHGKGTGALRKVVQEYLHEHPQIKSYRLGNLNEGGDGVTIVEFQ